MNSDKAASEALAAVGITGIKYLDGNSRSTGEGSYNYVIFDGRDVQIVSPEAKPEAKPDRYQSTTGPANEAFMSDLLAPKGQSAAVGPETGQTLKDGIAKFENRLGSTRYVYMRGNQALAVLQVMSRDGSSGVIANIFTTPGNRRQGLMSTLLARAERDFKLTPSADLSPDGAAFFSAVNLSAVNLDASDALTAQHKAAA